MSTRVTAGPADKLRDYMQPIMEDKAFGVSWLDFGRHCLEFLGRDRDLEDYGPHNAMRTIVGDANIGDLIDHAAGAALLSSEESDPDTTLLWTREMPALSFQEIELFALTAGSRLARIAPGGTSPEGFSEFARTTYKLGRYSRKFLIDEMDMIESGRAIAADLVMLAEAGVEARRVRPDLVYSLVLGNPTLPYDKTSLFHADHSNIAAEALGSSGLSGAIAALGNQTMLADDGKPIHLNRRGQILVVPPNLVHGARKLAREISLGDGEDVTVLQESRLGTNAVVDPVGGTTRTGSATNWLLAAPAAQIPAVVVLGLNGPPRPEVRRFTPTKGRFGIGFDIKVDIAAVAVDFRGLYFSTGPV